MLVTGASRGIGAATAIALARQGVRHITLQYNTCREGVEKTIEAVQRSGVHAAAIQADLSVTSGIHSFLKAFDPKVDIVINNAGSLIQRTRLAEISEDLFDRVSNLNYKSAWMIAQAVAPHMAAQSSGVIVNLSSIAARNGGGIGASLYAASKAAVACITKGLARELAPQGIRVNAVSPGTIDNDFHQQFSTQAMLDNVVAQTPAGRLGTNEDVADVIVFLCSDAARYIHGQTIEINGGGFMI